MSADPQPTQWARLAEKAAPAVPQGPFAQVANRILTYTRPSFIPAVLPHLDDRRGGLVLAGARTGHRLTRLVEDDYDGVVLIDPAAYEHYTATPDAPFWLPDNQLFAASLDQVLDQQRAAGAAVALTPTGYIAAGDTDSLRAAAERVRQLDRQDVIFVVPLDVSLADTGSIQEVTAILADTGRPIGLILGGQFDPLQHSPSRVIPNLRNLAVSVPLMPLRTDFNALDLIAHGAFAGAIGTAGSTRHAVDPTVKPRSWNPADRSPNVLFTELLCWWRGSKIADLYGARPLAARRCTCPVCEGQRLTRFRKPSSRTEALAHNVAVWSHYVGDMLGQSTMRARAEYWRTLCQGSVREYGFISTHLHLLGNNKLQPQEALTHWAELPAWPA